MTRAVQGARLFYCDADRRRFLGLLGVAAEREDWRILSFVLMDNHVHLLMFATTDRLSRGLWWLHSRYAAHYKQARDPHRGHVFGGRARTKPVGDDAYLLCAARYIAMNPVPVLCDRPEQYPWSAHRALIGEASIPPLLARDELLTTWFGGDADRYERFVLGDDPPDHRSIRSWAGPIPDRPELQSLIADRTGASFRVAHVTWGYSVREIARAAEQHHSTIDRAILRAADL
jgi:REP element-mobilizing transposase RayT